MKFKSGTRRRALEYEKYWDEKWKQDKTFEKSVENRSKDNSYVFYDGPPFITGVPHHGTLLSSIIKDAVPRYWTMKGKRVERVWGWDSHGLPAENFVEKQLGITDRRDIGTKISLEDYIVTARNSMVANSETWEGVVGRVGRWVDFKGAYKTMDKEYMESVWWAFKTLYEKGKIYEGEKVLMYDTKFATPVSKNEVTMDNDAYQTVTDPSVYVRFHLNPGQKYANDKYETKDAVYMIAWTTTPWTLPSNTGLAVNTDLSYTALRIDGVSELLIVASEKVDSLFKEHDVEIVHDDIKGSDLVGLEYEPLLGTDQGENAHKVWAADYVTADDGSGIVHLAPAYGEIDFEFAKLNNIPVVHALDDNGYYFKDVAQQLYAFMPWKDASEPLEVWSSNKDIAKALHKAGIVWKIDYIQHEYPFNPRSKQRIMYRAIPSWFYDIQGQKNEMFAQNTEIINWFPEHLKHGRFEKNIQQAPDWNLSRDRFWATGLPVWKGIDADGNEKVKVIGSYAELKEISGMELEDYHRPWVDAIEFDFEGVHYKRVEKVLDGWFESGSMPFAQFHYPFENKEKFEANFPGDFIAEYVGQVRAWFYYLHVVNVGLFGKAPFKNVITTGTLAGNDGRKMSKSLGNYTDPNELMDKFSGDSLRFILLSSPLLNGEDFSLQDKDVGDVARKLSMVWNMYDFFTMYAEVDGWEFNGELEDPLPDAKNPLDIWIISRLHQLVAEVEENMDNYNVPNAMSPILPFLDDASNWFVRRSRRRFWKSEDDGDKQMAYRTLHYVLTRLAYVLAPFTPFLAEELYSKLTDDNESVHLKDWLPAGHVNELVLGEMETVREYVNQALSIRAKEGVKTRQPLASVTIPSSGTFVNFEDILLEELNVKKVLQGDELKLDLTITPELKREGLMREVIRHAQSARKQAGLNVDDHIKLSLSTDADELSQAISEHAAVIQAETLCDRLDDATYSHESSVKIEGIELVIRLEKVS
jgi:isoleucyl-tRNA synthetase